MNQDSDGTIVTPSFVAHALLIGTIRVRLHITMLIYVHVYVVAVQGSSVVMMIWVT